MRRRLPWILLAVSLVANVFFVAGAAYTRFADDRAGRSPEARIAAVAERLDLSAEQRDGLMALRERVRGHWKDKSARGQWRAAMLAELAEPAFDREGVAAILDERSAERRARLLATMADLHAYLATLSPEQRAAFLDMARERGFLRGLFGRSRRKG